MLAKFYQQYKERAEFYIIYIQEAHTSDGWHLPENIQEKVIFAAPLNIEERSAVAGTCMLRLHIPIPGLIDNFDNTTELAYTGWPDRLYVIDRNGRVAYKSKPGPFGFQPAKMERSLELVL